MISNLMSKFFDEHNADEGFTCARTEAHDRIAPQSSIQELHLK